jgi:integrase
LAWQYRRALSSLALLRGNQALGCGFPLALRHYYASKLIEKGKDLKMGHSKTEITLNVYGHLLKGRDEAHIALK